MIIIHMRASPGHAPTRHGFPCWDAAGHRHTGTIGSSGTQVLSTIHTTLETTLETTHITCHIYLSVTSFSLFSLYQTVIRTEGMLFVSKYCPVPVFQVEPFDQFYDISIHYNKTNNKLLN